MDFGMKNLNLSGDYKKDAQRIADYIKEANARQRSNAREIEERLKRLEEATGKQEV